MIKLIDNTNYTLATDLKGELKSGVKLKIAASYFSIYAYEVLKKELEKIDELQFIFTKPTFVADKVTDRIKKERREFYIPQQQREKGLYGTEFEIHLKNQLTQKAIAKECADWIRRKVKFKSNNNNAPMQEFMSLQGADRSVAYSPIQGFTPMGLGVEKGNAVSNFIQLIDDQPMVKSYLNLFEQIWQDKQQVEDVTDEILRYIESVYQENPPERIYFLMLYNIFKDFLEDINEDVLPNNLTGYQDTLIWKKLFNFQKDAAVGIINKLETYNGCILADSVGLGKTFTALAVIKYYELRNKSVLVLCPKKLSENWTNYNANLVTNLFVKDRFNYDVLYHTDLSRHSGYTLGIDLSRVNWGNYDLVVIDESHNFRNRGNFKDRETRYDRLMREVIREGVKTKVLMLSATPVNNHFTDLKNQLALAYEGETQQLESRLDTEYGIETIFSRAQRSFNVWAQMPPEKRTTQAILNLLDFDFFKLLDSVTIARSRKHIQAFYDTQDIGQFPKRLKPLSFRCAISIEPNFTTLNEIYTKLSAVKMVVYAPVSYIHPSALSKYEELFDTEVQGRGRLKQVDREESLKRLMTINVLKRLESSVHAFRLTLLTLLRNIDNMLDSIESFQQRQLDGEVSLASDYGYDADENEDADNVEDLIGKTLKIHLGDMDIISWRRDLTADRAIIQKLIDTIEPVTPECDAKLKHLEDQIVNKIRRPINKDNRKVIIFTAFADTANYLYDNLATKLLDEYGIHSAKITGSNNSSTIKNMVDSQRYYDMQGLLTLFSPESKQKADIFPEEEREIDILIATDCISEGQNLQDCDYLINYDIHWNPVRIIQRFGRIDRIGSKNDAIQLVNYWPDISLDEYINLRERVEDRMVIVDMTSTGDDNVLSAKANDVAYRREQLKRLQNEVLDLEDANTGVSITDLGLNDFRMDLLSYIDKNPEIKRLPTGLHTVVPAHPESGLVPGVIFILKSRDPVSAREQNNRLYPYFLVYISTDGEIVYDYTQAKYLLDMARKACRGQDEPIPAVFEPFNKRTKDGRDMSTYSALLDKVIHTIQDIESDSDINSLFLGISTTALEGSISGLNDFELISFIVIEESS